jgi:CarD family transcriptional regulator
MSKEQEMEGLYYSVGSKVVHPCYGAGTVVRIQQKSLGEITHIYYVIDTLPGSMRVMVPINQANQVGLREVGSAERLRSILQDCGDAPDADDIDTNFRTRSAEMSEQLKSGSFEEVAEVVRMLFFMNSRRSLGMTDRRYFEQGKEILSGELALATGQDMGRAKQEVEGYLNGMLNVKEA